MEHQAILWCNQLVVQVGKSCLFLIWKMPFSTNLNICISCRFHIRFLVWWTQKLVSHFPVLRRGFGFLPECFKVH